MYIILKKDKAEDFSEKLHKVKAMVCDVLEEMEYAAEKEYSHEEAMRHSYSRHEGRHMEHGRERGRDFDDFDRDFSRGRSGGYSRGRY